MPEPESLLLRDYLLEDECTVPFYGCRLEAAEPNVGCLKIRKLSGNRIVLFGTYDVLLLFSYESGGETKFFTRKYENTLAEVFDLGEKRDYADGDSSPEVEFKPKAECSVSKKTRYLWNIRVSGVIRFLKPEPFQKEKKEIENAAEEEPRVISDDGPVTAHRIVQNSGVNAQTLLKLDRKSLEEYFEKD